MSASGDYHGLNSQPGDMWVSFDGKSDTVKKSRIEAIERELAESKASLAAVTAQRDAAQRALTETMDRLRPTVDVVDERHVWERWEKARDAK